MLFSVIIPTFNRRALVCEAIGSVLRQTHADFELIVVDDGSTDGTSEAVFAISVGEPRLRLITKSNGGRSSARNSGIEAATGQWLVFLDSDDLLDESALEIFSKAIGEYPDAGLIAARKIFIDEDGTPIPAPWNDNESNPTYGWIENPHEKLIRSFFFTPGSFCVERTVCPRFDPEFEACEDYEFLLNVSLNAKVVRLKDEVLFYRWHSGNTSEERFFEARERIFVRQLTRAKSMPEPQKSRIEAEWAHRMADDRYLKGEWGSALSLYLKATFRNPRKFFDLQMVRQILASFVSLLLRRSDVDRGEVR